MHDTNAATGVKRSRRRKRVVALVVDDEIRMLRLMQRDSDAPCRAEQLLWSWLLFIDAEHIAATQVAEE